MLRKRPFQMFRIHVTDGTVYEIRHPEMMVVGRTKALVFFPPRDCHYLQLTASNL